MKKKKILKKSRYIFITLISIIFGLISFYYIDAEAHKPTAELLEIKKQQTEENNYLNAELNVAYDDCINDRTNAKKWHYFIKVLKKRNATDFNYINYNNLIPIANYIANNYSYFNDIEALKHMTKECERVYNIQRNSFIDDTYAELLFELGETQTARKVEAKLKEKKLARIPKHVVTWINNELAKNTKKPLANFNSADFFKEDTATIVGYIDNYNGNQSLNFKTGKIQLENHFKNSNYPKEVTVLPDGRFKVKFIINHPIYSKLKLGNNYINFYIEPGQRLGIINGIRFLNNYNNTLEKNYIYLGSLSDINQDLFEFNFKEKNWEQFIKKAKKTNPIDFKKEELFKLNNQLEKLEIYHNKRNIKDKTYTILKNKILLDHYITLLDYPKNHNEQLSSIYTLEKFKDAQKIIHKSYYGFIKDINLNSQSLLINNEFGLFINGLEHDIPGFNLYVNDPNQTKKWHLTDSIAKSYEINTNDFVYKMIKNRNLKN